MKLLAGQIFHDRNQTAMPARAAAGPDANAPEWQIQVIIDDNQVCRRNSIFTRQGLDALTAAVHVNLRFGQHDLFIFKRTLADERAAKYFSNFDSILRRQAIDDKET
jgi:hypothetical protein